MAEKRKYVRLDIKMLVKWRKLSPTSERLPALDIVKDISRGGVCFVVREKLEIGDNLSLEIKLPSGKIVKSKGKVKRRDPILIDNLEQEEEYKVGVEFIDIDGQDRENWNKFVFEHF